MKILGLSFLIPVSLGISSKAHFTSIDDLDQKMNQNIRRFHESPKEVMNELPLKTGFRVPRFEAGSLLENKKYLDKKDGLRQRLCRQSKTKTFCPQLGKFSSKPLAGILEAPQEIRAFLEGGAQLKNIYDFKDHTAAEIQSKPWSDTYWPLAKGGLGQRYADPNFPFTESWLGKYEYSFRLDIFKENPKDRLSPSEKYDVLVNDHNKSLTVNMWNQGKYYQDSTGAVESWMGLCHGWAPASYMMKRPLKAVTIPLKTEFGADQELRFLPADIKGLATLLWSNSNMDSVFVGGRCNEKNPAKDENGRTIDSTCFDVNPGLFHTLLIQRILANHPFIFDATYDYEVWNQPVLGYKFSYFNPQSLSSETSLQAAVVNGENYTLDKFKKYRDPRAKYFVGIKMKVHYLSENLPTVKELDGPEADVDAWAGYIYDLELDENFNIIGGEWYNSSHPDFLWTPKLNVKALSREDSRLQGQWTEKGDIPKSWQTAAPRASEAGQPLAKIVEQLIEWAQ